MDISWPETKISHCDKTQLFSCNFERPHKLQISQFSWIMWHTQEMVLLFFCKEFMILKYAVAVFWPDFLWLICRENLIDAFFFQSPDAFSHTFLNMKFNDFYPLNSFATRIRIFWGACSWTFFHCKQLLWPIIREKQMASSKWIFLEVGRGGIPKLFLVKTYSTFMTKRV